MGRTFCTALLALGCCAGPAVCQEYEREPIRYSQSTPANVISSMQSRMDKGETKLEHQSHFGYLKAVLRELSIPESSQTLVFSKTSLQRSRISPELPRSLYFNDSAYIGFCQDGEVLEVSVADPVLGAVFYTLDQDQAERPKFVRQTDSCLLCHGSSQTQGVPGHLVRSVFPDASGQPVLSLGTYRIDHSSTFDHRWGGWYVTGTYGDLKHFGNQIFRKSRELSPEAVRTAMNVTDLSDRIETGKFLTPHSDLVALMVLEHQTEGHNLITRANFLTRAALDFEANLRRELNEASTTPHSASTLSRIRNAGEPLVKYLLFSDETPLPASGGGTRIRGTSSFAEDFARQGPRDGQGRSLRDFDLEKRMFRYPCSYLIYTDSFDALPDDVRTYVWTRLDEILAGREKSGDFRRLSPEDRRAVREILVATKGNLPDSWRHSPARGRE